MGADAVYVHFGADQRAEDVTQDTIGLVPAVQAAVKMPVGASSFDTEGGAAAVRAEGLEKFGALMDVVYQQGGVTIYRRR